MPTGDRGATKGKGLDGLLWHSVQPSYSESNRVYVPPAAVAIVPVLRFPAKDDLSLTLERIRS